MNLLEEGRLQINEIDRQMIQLFEARMEAVEKILAYKKENGLPVFDADREKANVERMRALLKRPELESFFTEWYRKMMDVSKDYQRSILKED